MVRVSRRVLCLGARQGKGRKKTRDRIGTRRRKGDATHFRQETRKGAAANRVRPGSCCQEFWLRNWRARTVGWLAWGGNTTEVTRRWQAARSVKGSGRRSTVHLGVQASAFFRRAMCS